MRCSFLIKNEELWMPGIAVLKCALRACIVMGWHWPESENGITYLGSPARENEDKVLSSRGELHFLAI